MNRRERRRLRQLAQPGIALLAAPDVPLDVLPPSAALALDVLPPASAPEPDESA